VNTSKSFIKLKTTLDLQPEEKLLIGKLANSATNPNLGYIDVFFEIENGIVTVPDPLEFSDSEYIKKTQVFIRGGYENYEKEYSYDNLFLFKARLNTQSSDKGACKLTCVYSDNGIIQHSKMLKEHSFIAEVSQEEFNEHDIKNIVDSHKIESYEKDFQDTPHFFQINTESKRILGPLISNDNDKSIFHGPRNTMTYVFWNSRPLSDYQTFLCNYEGFEKNIVSINTNGITRTFLINLESFYIGKNGKPRNQDFTVIDLIPENCLVNEFYKSTDKISSIKPYQKSKVKEWLDNKGIKLDTSRKSRIYSILTGYEKNQEAINDIFKKVLDSDTAEPLLKKIANEDEELYLERYRDKENVKIEKIKNETVRQKEEIEQQNDAVKLELSKKQQELTTLNKEKNTLQKKIDEELKLKLENVELSEEYQNMLSEKNKELSDVNNEIESAIKIFGHYTELNKLKNKKHDFEEDIKYLERRKKEQEESNKNEEENLNKTIEELKKQAQQETSLLATTYLNHQIISDIQNYDHYKYIQEQPIESNNAARNIAIVSEPNQEFMTDNCNANRKAVVNAVTIRLHQMNRSIDLDKVEAALIAIMQNQYVVLMGIPGSGKTSFALQFSCALGAFDSTLLIPVAKDWTKPKDLMGYYNPITNKYESGVTDFYPFYHSLNQNEEETTTNSFLILDEFNLSQPEFYMSNLTGLADNSISRKINLGHDTNITIPTTNKFICTANTDETVQSLSARMISRCVFIHFNELHELNQTIEDLTFPDNLPPLLSGTDMVSLFKASESDIISTSLTSEINKLISAFRDSSSKYGNGISITPRKYNQLLQFCKVMSVQEYGQSKVLDYASVFFLLPLISGSGSLFKSRLINIKSIGEDLSLEDFVRHIECIINEGEANFEHYRFIMG
jgi:MoxR-like ATPase